MEPEGVLTSGDEAVGRYNLRGRSVDIKPCVSGRFDAAIKASARAKNATKTAPVTRGTGTSIAAAENVSCRFGAMTRARARAKNATKTAPVTCGTGTSRAAAEKNTDKKLDEKPSGTPFPRWKLPGYKINYPFKPDGDRSVWPSSREQQRAIMESTVKPFVPLALKVYMSDNNLCDQDDLEFVRMVDICAIHFYGTVFNLKFEAKSVGSVDHESSTVFFAQVHFSKDPTEKGHISRCCLYDPDMSDIPYIHADCLVCFPDPSDGYQLNGEAGKCAAAVLNRVVRVRRKRPADLFEGCYFLTKQERVELRRYHSIGLAKLALDDFKTKTTNDEDAGLEFLRAVKSRISCPPDVMFNIKFKVKRGNSVDSSPKLFLAQVHMFSHLYDVGVDAHVSACYPYDPNDPGFPPYCSVCNPQKSRGKRVNIL